MSSPKIQRGRRWYLHSPAAIETEGLPRFSDGERCWGQRAVNAHGVARRCVRRPPTDQARRGLNAVRRPNQAEERVRTDHLPKKITDHYRISSSFRGSEFFQQERRVGLSSQ